MFWLAAPLFVLSRHRRRNKHANPKRRSHLWPASHRTDSKSKRVYDVIESFCSFVSKPLFYYGGVWCIHHGVWFVWYHVPLPYSYHIPYTTIIPYTIPDTTSHHSFCVSVEAGVSKDQESKQTNMSSRRGVIEEVSVNYLFL